ncbi:MAG: sulfatase-like hydrolase/transferase [Chloroflexi bacterium]|nr:sulfatase-like hydrolase/transferase [Chloroflexota bacterium]
MRQPNILFVMVDCLRGDTVWDRHRYPSLPTLDALASRAVVFTACAAAATTTTPSVATMLTGLPPARHGIRSLLGYKLQPEVRTLAQELTEGGYFTAAETTGPLFPETGLNRGFRAYHRRDRHHYLGGGWGKELCARLRRRVLPEPWFLFLHVWELHWPRRASRRFNRPAFGKSLYQRSMAYTDHLLGELFEQLDPDNTVVVLTGDHGEGIAGAIDNPSPLVQAGLQWSYRLTRRLPPETKKRILTAARGLILVGTGKTSSADDVDDSAPPTAREDVAGHAHLCGYDYLTRVPLIVRAPGQVPCGVRISTQVRHMDIAPTILDLAGLGGYRPGLAPSLLPAARGEETIDRPAATEAMRTMLLDPIARLVAYRDGSHKLIFAPENPEIPVELYDLRSDPGELSNLATRRPELVAQLRQQWQVLESDGQHGPNVGVDHRMSAEEEEIIRDRLEQLGYIE